MRVARFVLSIVLSSSFPFPSASQQASVPAPTSSPQAATLLTQSATALAGNVALSDVTLSGTTRRIAGSDDDTGTAVFKALASGASRMDLSLSSGQRSEVCDFPATTPTGTWLGPDRISHPIAFHNLVSEPAWFFPAFAIARRLSGSSYVVTYVAHETHNGQAVEHVSVAQTSSDPTPSDETFFEHLSRVEFFLDSPTRLLAAMSFNTHPDNNALLDIPIEVRFSDYRPVNGAQVPFHVQKYLNNNLILNFQVESVTLNSGLTASSFSL